MSDNDKSVTNEPNRAAKGVPMKALWSLALCIILIALVGGCATEVATNAPLPTQTVTEATPTAKQVTNAPLPTQTVTEATPMAKQVLSAFVKCERLVANRSMVWGQAPGVIYSGNPNITGRVVPGNYVRLLMPSPNADGALRVKVFPHDERVVGKPESTEGHGWTA